MHPLRTAADLSPLLDDLGDRPVVMLGEASHGTHEYYTCRTAISKRLLQERGFSFIAVEGDWPDCYRINRYVKGCSDAGESIEEVMHSFDRWPTWMWANWEVAALADWLREYNRELPPEKKVGFYGLDVYSLWDSMREMVEVLEEEDPDAAKAVRAAIRCFEPFGEDEQQYARATLSGHSCQDKVLAALREVRANAQQFVDDVEDAFSTEQNALIAVNAERYYRAMVSFDNESWNVRDRHMMDTLDRLMQFHGVGAKGIVWEHNTHIGDARATDMKRAGMVNIGQLARERYGEEKVYLVGFGSYEGTVVAGDEWGAPMKVMAVPPAREDSVEAWLHQQYARDGFLLFNEEPEGYEGAIPHRAIGVVYNPKHERRGNYVPSVMPERYDAFIFLDKTRALHPMRLAPDGHKMPETYPFGM